MGEARVAKILELQRLVLEQSTQTGTIIDEKWPLLKPGLQQLNGDLVVSTLERGRRNLAAHYRIGANIIKCTNQKDINILQRTKSVVTIVFTAGCGQHENIGMQGWLRAARDTRLERCKSAPKQ